MNLIPLEMVAQRNLPVYDAAQAAFAATNFEGVQGPVEYAPNSADPSGKVILQQLQAGDAIVDIADFKRGSFSFLGKSNLMFPRAESYCKPHRGARVNPAAGRTFQGRLLSRASEGGWGQGGFKNLQQTHPPVQHLHHMTA